MSKAKLKNQIGNLIFAGLLIIMFFLAVRYDLRYVETGSMEPQVQVGALCIIDPHTYDNDLPEVGDIAMYETSTRFVIHRIVRVEDGDYIFKGDNNDSEDYGAVPISQIRGRVVCTINAIAPLMRTIKHL